MDRKKARPDGTSLEQRREVFQICCWAMGGLAPLWGVGVTWAKPLSTLGIPRVNWHRCGKPMVSTWKQSTNSGCSWNFHTELLVYRLLNDGKWWKLDRKRSTTGRYTQTIFGMLVEPWNAKAGVWMHHFTPSLYGWLVVTGPRILWLSIYWEQ